MLTNFIIALIVLATLGYFLKVAKTTTPLQNTENNYVMCYSPIIKWGCMGLMIFAFLGLIAGLIFSSLDKEGLTAILIMLAFVILFAAYFYIEFFTVKILVGENGIIGSSGWRGKREYSWGEIGEISYSRSSMWFKISSHDKAPLRIHAFISGIAQFRKLYMEKLPEEKWTKSLSYPYQ